MYYYSARYYNPKIGKFISADPASRYLKDKRSFVNPQGFNFYSYTINNPVKYVDPSGEVVETVADLISLALSTRAFVLDGGFWNGTFMTLDAVGTVIPFVPSAAGYVKNSVRIYKIGKYFDEVATASGKSSMGIAKIFVKNALFMPSRRSWTIGTADDSLANLVGHFAKHGNGVGAKNLPEYYNKANDFIDNKQYTHVFDEGSDKVFYNHQSKNRVILDGNDNIKTFGQVDKKTVIQGYEERIKKGNYIKK